MPLLLGIMTICGLSYMMDVFGFGLASKYVSRECIGSLSWIGLAGQSTLPWDMAGTIGLGIMGTALLPIRLSVGPKWGMFLLGIGWYQLWRLRWGSRPFLLRGLSTSLRWFCRLECATDFDRYGHVILSCGSPEAHVAASLPGKIHPNV